MEQRLEAVRRDLTTRQDTSGEKFVITIEGQEIRDRGIAGALLMRRAERMAGTGAERQVGTIAGFRVFVADNFVQGPEIVLKGATTHTAKVTDTALGTMRSVEHAIQRLDELAEILDRNIADTRKRLADTQGQVDTRFEYAAQLAELVRRQDEIENILDLTRSQAPRQLESEPETDPLPGESGPVPRLGVQAA